MKQLFIASGALFLAAIILSSFTDVHNGNPSNYTTHQQVLSVPVKQKAVVVVTSVTRCKQLLKKGFILQDMDIDRRPVSQYSGTTTFYYTMIKY